MNCTCYRSPWLKVNIFKCHNKGLTKIPDSVVMDTDWLILSGNNFGSINNYTEYLNTITLLNLSSSNIDYIDDIVMESILQNVKQFDIRKNKLTKLPKSIVKASRDTKLWISGNPYECSCDMLWMRDWLLSSNSVIDKENVTCIAKHSKGTPFYSFLESYLADHYKYMYCKVIIFNYMFLHVNLIFLAILIYKLDSTLLGCGFPLWGIILLVVGSTFVIILAVIINRKWTTIKFHYYAKFTNDDDSQDVSQMKYDAFVSCK